MSKELQLHGHSFGLFPPTNSLRRRLLRGLQHWLFHNVIFFLVLLNCVCLVVEPQLQEGSTGMLVLGIVDLCCGVFFTVEFGVKVFVHGLIVGPFTYFRHPEERTWNVMDFAIVVVGWGAVLVPTAVGFQVFERCCSVSRCLPAPYSCAAHATHTHLRIRPPSPQFTRPFLVSLFPQPQLMSINGVCCRLCAVFAPSASSRVLHR